MSMSLQDAMNNAGRFPRDPAAPDTGLPLTPSALHADNARMREALELIANSKDIRFDWPRKIAKEALK